MDLSIYSETHFPSSSCPHASAACLLMMDLWMEGLLHTTTRDRIAARIKHIRRTNDKTALESVIEILRRHASGTDYAGAPVLASV